MEEGKRIGSARAEAGVGFLLRVWQKLNTFWLILGAISLGVLLGLAMSSPSRQLMISILGLFVHLVSIIANPLYGLLLWVVSSPLGEMYINISLGASIPDISPARFCIVLLIALLLAQTAIRRRDLLRLTAADVSGLLLIFGLGLSIGNEYSGWQEMAQVIFDRYCTPLLVYFLAKNLITRRRDVDTVLVAVLFFGFYASVYAIYENQTGNILFSDSATFTIYEDSGLHVLRGLLDRSDHFGALFSMAIPVNFYLYLKARTPLKRIVCMFTLGTLFVGMYLTYKRTAWIAILVTFFIIQLFYARFRQLFLLCLLVVLVVLGATWDTVSQSAVVTDRINSRSSTIDDRTSGWNAAIDLWAHRPIFGYGFGNYRAVAQESGVDDTALESEHMAVLFGTGLLGFVPYVAWFVLLLRDSVRLFLYGRKNPARLDVEPELSVFFWGILVAYIINYSTSIANVFPVAMVFYLLAGTLVGSQTRFLDSARQTTRAPGNALVG
jgi:O-antigen ligase